jgi:hypothetical protein
MKTVLFVCLCFFVGCGTQVASKTEEQPANKATELLVQAPTPPWWQPTEVTTHENGSVAMTWSSKAAKDEYDRQERLKEEAMIANAPDDAFYVFDDAYDPTTGTSQMARQDNGERNKLGIQKSVNTNYSALMPQFQQIAEDNASRITAFTGTRLAAVQACDPHYWNVSIESVKPLPNGVSIRVLAICGSRANGYAAEIKETWSYVDNQLTLASRRELISMAPYSN